MKLMIDEGRLLPGTALENDVLVMPPEGGGVLLPELAESGGRWLNLTMTVLADHAQAFELRVYGRDGELRVLVRFGLMPRLRAAVALDLNWLDGHILFPGHRVGTQKVVCHGSRISRSEIGRAELAGMPCFDPVAVRVEDPAIEDAPRPVAPVEGEALIDAFGQYKLKEWPGIVHSEKELTGLLRDEAMARDGSAPGATDAVGARRAQVLADVSAAVAQAAATGDDAFERARASFNRECARQAALAEEADAAMERAYAFLDEAFGAASQEAVIFTTRVSADTLAIRFVADYGSDAFLRHNKGLLVETRKRELLRELDELS